MNIPIDVAYGAVTTFWGTGGEARELRKHKLKSISRAWKKNGVKEFSKKFALVLVDFFEVIKFAVSNTGGVVFNPKNPEAWYENTSIVTARNEQSQLLTVYDVTPPYVLDSSSLPVTDSARTQAILRQDPVMEATDFGGVRFRRVKRELRRQFEPVDDCNQPFLVSTSMPDAAILPLGPTPTVVEWEIEERGGPYDPEKVELASNQSLVDGRVVTTFRQFVTVRDTQAPLLLAPPGFARYARSDVVLANEDRDYLGRPRVIDLADANPQVTKNAPAVLEVDRRHFVRWQARDATGNTTDEQVLVVTLKSPGTNTPPLAHGAAAKTRPFVNPETGSADISRKVDIQLTASDGDVIDGIPDPLEFRIADYPDGGEFEAPLLPFFITDYRVTPNGETVDNEGSYARTSPLKALAQGFYLADKPGHPRFLDDNICKARPGSYGATEFDNVIPLDFIYRPEAIFVDDAGFTYVQDWFWACGETNKNNSYPFGYGRDDLHPIRRISKWAEDGTLVAMRALTAVDDPGFPEVLDTNNSTAFWDGHIDRSGRLWINYDPVYTHGDSYSFNYYSIDTDLYDVQHHGSGSWNWLNQPEKMPYCFRIFALDEDRCLL